VREDMIDSGCLTAILMRADEAKDLPELANAALSAHRACEESFKTTLTLARAAGLALLKAKAALPHGGWLPWLRDCCPISERTAQLYMRIADGCPAAGPTPTLGVTVVIGGERDAA